MTQLNFTAVKAMAIATAYYQRDWIPGTSIEEVYHDFIGIAEQAEDNLKWAKIGGRIYEEDIAEALFGMDEEEFIDWLVEQGVDV